MEVRVDCPKCAVRLRLRESLLGTHVHCAACNHAFEAQAAEAPSVKSRPPRIEPLAADAGATHSLFEGVEDGDVRIHRATSISKGTVRISTLMAGVYALLLTVVLGILMRVVIPHTYVATLFSHGWISFFTAYLGAWAAFILVLKSRRILFEKQALRFDVLSQEEEEVIRPTNVNRFTSHINALPERFRSSILFRRIGRALEYFRSTGSASGVSAYLASQSDLDAAESDSSYTMIRAFIWAVPILGFIGTVSGIGDSVSSFATSVDAAQEVDAIRESLGGVTGGLGTAFETTLVALVISILLMLPTNWLQKTEDDLLTSVGTYCNEELIWRFERGAGVAPSGSGPQDGAGSAGALSDAATRVRDMVSGLESSSDVVMQKLDIIGTEGLQSLQTASVALGEVSESLKTELPQLIAHYGEQIDKNAETTSGVLTAQQEMREQFAKAAEGESFESLLSKVNQTHEQMTVVLGGLHEYLERHTRKHWWQIWR